MVVVCREPNDSSNKVCWKCLCDCGKYVTVRAGELRHGDTKSCGCLQKEIAIRNLNAARTIRLLNKRPRHWKLYSVWYQMLRRCENQDDESYANYGGRGISVCAQWKNDFYSFQSWALSHGYQEGLTIDRIDNNGNYEPGNCHWATYKEQNNNYRRNVMLMFRGQERTIAQWSETTGLSHALIWQRIFSLGWPIERALTEPVKHSKRE